MSQTVEADEGHISREFAPPGAVPGRTVLAVGSPAAAAAAALPMLAKPMATAPATTQPAATPRNIAALPNTAPPSPIPPNMPSARNAIPQGTPSVQLSENISRVFTGDGVSPSHREILMHLQATRTMHPVVHRLFKMAIDGFTIQEGHYDFDDGKGLGWRLALVPPSATSSDATGRMQTGHPNNSNGPSQNEDSGQASAADGNGTEETGRSAMPHNRQSVALTGRAASNYTGEESAPQGELFGPSANPRSSAPLVQRPPALGGYNEVPDWDRDDDDDNVQMGLSPPTDDPQDPHEQTKHPIAAQAPLNERNCEPSGMHSCTMGHRTSSGHQRLENAELSMANAQQSLAGYDAMEGVEYQTHNPQKPPKTTGHGSAHIAGHGAILNHISMGNTKAPERAGGQLATTRDGKVDLSAWGGDPERALWWLHGEGLLK